jgi:hypothetical protein
MASGVDIVGVLVAGCGVVTRRWSAEVVRWGAVIMRRSAVVVRRAVVTVRLGVMAVVGIGGALVVGWGVVVAWGATIGRGGGVDGFNVVSVLGGRGRVERGVVLVNRHVAWLAKPVLGGVD